MTWLLLHVFRKLQTGEKTRILCSKIYLLSNTTELAKDYKLKDQINGSSGSIMDNIAEGFGRGGNKEFIQFLEVSHASSTVKCQSQLCRIVNRKYIDKDKFDELYSPCIEIKKMIVSLINYLQASDYKGIKFVNR